MLFSLFHAVVVDLDGKHDGRRNGGDGVRDHQRLVEEQDALDHEKDASEPKQEEGWEGDTVGVAGADGVDGLREIAADHADGGCIADYVYDQW